MAAASGGNLRWSLASLVLLLAVWAAGAEEIEEEDDQTKAVNLGISVMLLLTVTFVMLLFWLVHHKDPDIMKYSWKVISQTISIFCAVLLFQACDGIVKWKFLEGREDDKWAETVVNFFEMISWFMFLQAVLAILSGAVDELFPCLTKQSEKIVAGNKVKSKISHKSKKCVLQVGQLGEVRCIAKDGERLIVNFPTAKNVKIHPDHVEKEWEISGWRRRMLKCWAVLLGHITGFSAINFFATIQSEVPARPLYIFAVPPVAYCLIHLVCKMTSAVRERVSLADDGKMDEAEELWSEETEETEDDIVALSVSFLVCQGVRYHLTGSLPSTEGEDPENFSPSFRDMGFLVGFGMAVSLWEAFRMTILLKYIKSFGRPTTHMRDITLMTCSWCLFFGGTWLVIASLPTTHGMLRQIIVAGFTTMVAVILIFVLDTIADLDRTGPQVDKIVRSMVSSLSILIGFAWEKSFDIAVECTSESVERLPKVVTKLLMSLLLVGIVIPNWMNHILPTILRIEAEEEAEDEMADLLGFSASDIAKTGMSALEAMEAVEGEDSVGLGMATSVSSLRQPLLFEPSGELSFNARSSSKASAGAAGETALNVGVLAEAHKRHIAELHKQIDGLEAGLKLAPDEQKISKLQRRNLELETNLVEVVTEIRSLQAIAGEPIR